MTALAVNDTGKVLARLKFPSAVICFQIVAEVLIVSSGDGLYMFCLNTFQKRESFQCSSTFGVWLSFKSFSDLAQGQGDDSVRIAY